MPIKHANPDALYKLPELTQVVVSSAPKLAFISGQTALNANFEMVGGNDPYQQMLAALRHLKIAIEGAGSRLENLVSATVYIRDLTPELGAKYMQALAEALADRPYPAHAFSLVGVSALASNEILVEIAAVAAIDG